MAEPDASSDENGPAAKKMKIDSGFLYTDMILRVEDEKLHVNRDLLVSASPVFEAWLKKDWQTDEPTESGKVELSLPGKSVNDMTTFLRCLLPSFPDQVSVETLDTVLPLAEEYQAEILLSECFDVIHRHIQSVFTRKSDISLSQIVKYLHWFDQCKPGNDDIRTDLLSVAACENMEELRAVEGFDDIGEALRLDVAYKSSKLYGVLFMSTPCDIEETIHSQSSAGNVCIVQAYFLRKRKGSVSLFLEQILNLLEECTISTSYYSKSMKDLLFCLSIADTLEITSIYNKCISMLTRNKITSEKFRTSWNDLFRKGRNNDNKIIRKHMDKLT